MARELTAHACEVEEEEVDAVTIRCKPGLVVGITSTVLPILTFTITYALSISNGSLEWPYYFLSSSINYAPQSCVGTLGLATATAFLALYFSLRYAAVKYALAQVPPGGRTLGTTLCGRRVFTSVESCNRLNEVGVCLGLISAFGALGVASFQAHAVQVAHLLFAAAFFLGGGVYVLFNLFLDFVVPHTSKRSRLARCVLLSALPMFFIVSVALTVAVPEAPAGEEDDSRHSTFVAAASVMEIVCLFVYVSYIASYVPSLARLRLEVRIHVDSAEMSAEQLSRTPLSSQPAVLGGRA